MKKACQAIVAIGLPLILFLGMLPGGASAQEPVKINLVSNQPAYVEGDPIQLQIRVFNNNLNAAGLTDPVITRKGFFYQDFHLLITFTDPDGLPVTRKFVGPADEPGPPYRIGERDAVLVEIISPDGDNTYVLHDAREYYQFTKTGWYTGQVLVPFDAFSEYETDAWGNLIAYPDDPGLLSLNPLASNKIRFEIAPPAPQAQGAIHAEVRLVTVGPVEPGTDRRSPLVNAEVRLFKTTDIPPDYYPVGWKTYGMIWSNAPVYRTALTDGNGLTKFSGLPQDDYLVLARHDFASDFKRLGATISAGDPGWSTGEPIVETMTLMVKSDKKKLPGKETVLTGSQLRITVPEYVEWDGEQEEYPVLLEAEGDWEVTTFLTPPAGFQVDARSKNETLTDEIKVMRFTVSGDGKEWKETKVKHKVEHNRKTRMVDSDIGVKLSRKLAKIKNKTIFGDTEAPGPFKGGKKVKKDKEK